MEQEKLNEILREHRNWVLYNNGECADLQDADLRRTYLRRTYLQGADLQDADLRGAYLRGADLRGADLQDADLQDADLRGAYFQDANLRDADLRGAYLPHFQNCPEEGSFIGFKKLRDDTIAKLLIPAEAKRTSALTGRKCRAEFVDVLEGSGNGLRDQNLFYEEGTRMYPDVYDPDIRMECSKGIHFFLTRKEAEGW